tara:strand:- start:192 stop:647 length:456 start_codon:yes stop_codon:yes gene_type:complete
MKYFYLIIFFFLSNVSLASTNSDLVNKAIICTEIYNDFKSMYGFKFINNDSVQLLIKNTDTLDVLTNNILKYNLSNDIIYIIGLNNNRMINYGFNIFRETLDIWAFNVTALEPFFDKNQCAVLNNVPIDFKTYFKSIFNEEINISENIKKI